MICNVTVPGHEATRFDWAQFAGKDLLEKSRYGRSWRLIFRLVFRLATHKKCRSVTQNEAIRKQFSHYLTIPEKSRIEDYLRTCVGPPLKDKL